MATRNDVAKLARVSPATVSFVINGTKNITPAVKKRVLDAIKTLNYRPNQIARSLVSQKSKHIGIILNEITSASIGEIVTCFEKKARESGYMTSLMLTGKDVSESFSNILQRRLDGLFISISFNGFTQEHMEILRNNNTFAVTGDCFMDNTSSVRCDYYQGMKYLMQYLQEHGHKKVGFISGLPLDDKTNLRFHYFYQQLENCGMEKNDNYFIGYDYDGSISAGYDGALKLIKNTDVTAIITLNEGMAQGAIKCLYDNNMSVAEDMSVCSCDGNIISDNLCPPLTYIASPKDLLGNTIFEKLLAAINGQPPMITLIPMTLHIGGTVGNVKPR